MRDLLRSHEEDIVERVFLQLSTQHTAPYQPVLPNTRVAPSSVIARQAPEPNSRLDRIAELESQIAQLRHEETAKQLPPQGSRILGMYDPSPQSMSTGDESSSGIAESVETHFPGVERSMII